MKRQAGFRDSFENLCPSCQALDLSALRSGLIRLWPEWVGPLPDHSIKEMTSIFPRAGYLTVGPLMPAAPPEHFRGDPAGQVRQDCPGARTGEW